jgi:hypothetical protein
MMVRNDFTFDAVNTVISSDSFHNEHEFHTQTLVPVLVLQRIQGLKKQVKKYKLSDCVSGLVAVDLWLKAEQRLKVAMRCFLGKLGTVDSDISAVLPRCTGPMRHDCLVTAVQTVVQRPYPRVRGYLTLCLPPAPDRYHLQPLCI